LQKNSPGNGAKKWLKKRKKSASFVSDETNKKQISQKLQGRSFIYPTHEALSGVHVSMKRATSQEELLLVKRK